jgi:protease secretion system membrane fusion protein
MESTNAAVTPMTDQHTQLAERRETMPAPAGVTPLYDNWYVLEEAQSPGLGRSSRLGLWALVVGFGGFLLWAGLAPLDEGVPSQGSVAIDTKRKPVQHLTGGLVKEVLVREGDVVKEGQVLARLDDAVSKGNYESLRELYLGYRAIQGRLEAENRGAKTIQFHPVLLSSPRDPVADNLMSAQTRLCESRQQALQADLQALEESIQGQRAMLRAYESSIGNRRAQLALLTEELNNTRGLVKDGYAPRNRQLELERVVADFNTALTDLLGNMSRTTRAINETQQRVIARRNEYRKEVESQLTDVTREAQAGTMKLRVAGDDFGRTEIKAPVGGQVMGLTIQTPGSVLPPGQKMMDIVPENETLLLETHVAPNLIDKVRGGLPVDIRFSAFAHSPMLTVQGQVVSVSNDLNEPQGGQPYYLARVAITPEGRKSLGSRQLQPGMPVEVVFKTGERTLLDYLLHPLTKRLAAAMKEE